MLEDLWKAYISLTGFNTYSLKVLLLLLLCNLLLVRCYCVYFQLHKDLFYYFCIIFFSKLSSIIKAFFFLTDKSLSFNLSVRLCFEKGKKGKKSSCCVYLF